MKVTDIIWDAECKDSLPTEINIPEELEMDEDAISDYISEVTGYCHKGFIIEQEGSVKDFPRFSSEEELKKYGKYLGDYGFEKAYLKDELIILSGTNKAWEEELWSDAYQMLQDFSDKFFDNVPVPKEGSQMDIGDLASQIRDLIEEEFCEKYKCKFVDVRDEY